MDYNKIIKLHRSHMRVLKVLLINVLIVQQFFVLPVCSADTNSTIIIGVHPYLPAAELEKRFHPLLDHIKTQTKITVELKISKDYETHIENIGNKVFDIAYVGPASYVKLTKQYGTHPVLARLEIRGKPYFNGYIITRQDSHVRSLDQLTGKKFAFGSPYSTMSYLVPRHMLREAGVELEALAEYKFLGNHRNVALGVLLGDFDAGAVKEEVFFKFKEKGLRQIAISPLISEHVFVCRKGFGVKKHKAIQKVLFTLSESEQGRSILSSIKQGATALVPVNDNDYDNLRVIMR